MAGDHARYRNAIQKGAESNRAAKWSEAVASFRVALGEFKDRPEVYAGLGESCVGLKRFDRALDCYKLAARFTPGEVEPLLKVADIQERLGRLSDAGQTYLAAGEYQLKRQQIDLAIGNWERAVRLEPNLLGAHQRLAMIFQRQGEHREAIREYLAIARILDQRGDKEKALKICRAALRLDPHNSDIQKAIRLIEKGEAAYPERMADPAAAHEADNQSLAEEEDAIFGAVRQMASVFEAERSTWNLFSVNHQESKDPVIQAGLLAEEELTAEILREENDDDDESSGAEMIKLERDALIGQAIDFEQRGDPARAISCYQKAIASGLDLPAAFYALGVLYFNQGNRESAYRSFKKGALDKRFAPAIRALIKRAS